MKTLAHIAIIVLLIIYSGLNGDFQNSRFYPDHAKIQFAGNQGFLSIGPGWLFFKERVEIDLMYGYLPEQFAGTDIHSITIKRTAIVFNTQPNNRWEAQATMDLSTIYTKTRNTHIIWPDYYPAGYYLPNAIHHQLSVGVRIGYNRIKNSLSRKVSFYTELGILDDHLKHHLKTGRGDIASDLNFACGVRFNLKTEEPARKID